MKITTYKKGRFGEYGGQYIPETLMNEIGKLEIAYEFYKKDDNIKTVQDLIKLHNQEHLAAQQNLRFETKVVCGINIRIAEIKNYPSKEIIGYKDFKNFILFCVLYCPDLYIERDTRKICYILKSAIPVEIRNNGTH